MNVYLNPYSHWCARCWDWVCDCEHCNAEGAEIRFDNILNRVTGSDPSVTDYILKSAAKCPQCRR